MASPGAFADLVVNFTTTGFGAVSQQLGNLQTGVVNFAASAKAAGQQVTGVGTAMAQAFVQALMAQGGGR